MNKMINVLAGEIAINFTTILTAVIIAVIIAAVLGLLLAVASKYLHVEQGRESRKPEGSGKGSGHVCQPGRCLRQPLNTKNNPGPEHVCTVRRRLRAGSFCKMQRKLLNRNSNSRKDLPFIVFDKG